MSKNSKSKRHYDFADRFLKNKFNVMKLGLKLELPFDKMCRLMWCRGHEFPISELDFDISENYIRYGEYELALEDFRELFNIEYIGTENEKEI